MDEEFSADSFEWLSYTDIGPDHLLLGDVNGDLWLVDRTTGDLDLQPIEGSLGEMAELTTHTSEDLVVVHLDFGAWPHSEVLVFTAE